MTLECSPGHETHGIQLATSVQHAVATFRSPLFFELFSGLAVGGGGSRGMQGGLTFFSRIDEHSADLQKTVACQLNLKIRREAVERRIV